MNEVASESPIEEIDNQLRKYFYEICGNYGVPGDKQEQLVEQGVAHFTLDFDGRVKGMGKYQGFSEFLIEQWGEGQVSPTMAGTVGR